MGSLGYSSLVGFGCWGAAGEVLRSGGSRGQCCTITQRWGCVNQCFCFSN